MTHDLVLLGVGLLLTVGTGLFVASEFALRPATAVRSVAEEAGHGRLEAR